MWEEQVCWWTIIFQIMEHYEDRWGPLLGLSEELVIKIVQCPDRSWYSHIKQQREAQFICTGVRVSQLDAIIPLQCATNEEEASYWLTDWLWLRSFPIHLRWWRWRLSKCWISAQQWYGWSFQRTSVHLLTTEACICHLHLHSHKILFSSPFKYISYV